MLDKKVEIPVEAQVAGLKMPYGVFRDNDPSMEWITVDGARISMGKNLWIQLAERIPEFIAIFDAKPNDDI